jgi:midasin (ATPase involved in ribosome maturation)
MNENTTITKLFGTVKISDKKFIVEDGPLKIAMERGYICMLDELNLASDEVHQFLIQLLDYPDSITNPILGNTIEVNPNFRLIFTQNPSSEQGRKVLPTRFMSKCMKLNVSSYSLE